MTLGANLLAFLLAFGLPIILVISRSVIRSQRGALYNDLIAVLYPDGGDALPLLELVRRKYAKAPAKVTPTTALGGRGHAKDAEGVEDARRQPPQLLLTMVFFGGVSFMGWATLLVPEACLMTGHAGACALPGPLHFAITDSYFWAAKSGDPSRDATVAIAAVAFLGAYVTAVQSLIRRLLNFELGAIAFVRASFQLFMGVVVAVVAFRALSPTVGGAAESLTPLTPNAIFAFWVGAAFLIGLAPQAGLSWLASQLKLKLQKGIDLRSLDSAKIISIEVIDGIDSEIRFRLEDNNISDVQNLATRNPVELYIETPYGLLEVFDWVLQAQLCTVVGAVTFDALKKHNIRTIFDLERAVLADRAPEGFIQALGEVLYAGADQDFRKAISLPSPGTGLDPVVIRHGVAVICDDLHVDRLRALWQRILERSSVPGGRKWLYRTTLLPGEDPDPIPPATPAAQHWTALAAAMGRDYSERLAAGEPPDSLSSLRDGALHAVRQALVLNPSSFDTLRRLWDPAEGVADGRGDLEAFFGDPDFERLLKPWSEV